MKVTVKVQRPSAELRENGAAKRHLPFPFSAHPPEGCSNPPFIYGGALSGAWGVTVKVRRRIGGVNSGIPNAPPGFYGVVARPAAGA